MCESQLHLKCKCFATDQTYLGAQKADVEYVSGEEANRVAHGGSWIMDGCRLESGRHETGPFFQANRTLSATAFRLVKFGEEAKN